jgi:hypothetical protein
MTISFTIPNNQVDLVVDSICFTYGYQEFLSDGSANPQSKTNFAKQCVVNMMKDSVKHYRRNYHVNNISATIEQEANDAGIAAV